MESNLWPPDTVVRVKQWSKHHVVRALPAGTVGFYVGKKGGWHIICIPGLDPPSYWGDQDLPPTLALHFWGADHCLGCYATDLEIVEEPDKCKWR